MKIPNSYNRRYHFIGICQCIWLARIVDVPFCVRAGGFFFFFLACDKEIPVPCVFIQPHWSSFSKKKKERGLFICSLDYSSDRQYLILFYDEITCGAALWSPHDDVLLRDRQG